MLARAASALLVASWLVVGPTPAAQAAPATATCTSSVGPGIPPPAGLAAGVAAGSVVMAIGLWRFHAVLRLSAMPGVSSIQRRLRRASN